MSYVIIVDCDKPEKSKLFTMITSDENVVYNDFSQAKKEADLIGFNAKVVYIGEANTDDKMIVDLTKLLNNRSPSRANLDRYIARYLIEAGYRKTL